MSWMDGGEEDARVHCLGQRRSSEEEMMRLAKGKGQDGEEMDEE